MAAITTDTFFKEKRHTSEIKSEILVKYFKFWGGILLYGQRYKPIKEVLYIDLYSGPGYYGSNSEPSTPIKILNSIYESTNSPFNLNIAVKTFFNDEKKSMIESLGKNILGLPFYNDLVHKPTLLNKPASKELLQSLIQQKIPALTFIDPFGYTYSLEMLLSAVRDWGSDLFMLFNMNRIRAAINNPNVEHLMNEIFQNNLSAIREFYAIEKKPRKREEFILNCFEKLFKDKGYFIFKFKINFPDKDQTSHYLYLVSKVKLAYFKIKDIMKQYSDIQPDGVPMFAANSVTSPIFYGNMHKFSMENLEEVLKANIINFVGKSIEEVYEEYSFDTNYIKENYKQAFENLLKGGEVKLINPKGKEVTKVTYTCKIQI